MPALCSSSLSLLSIVYYCPHFSSPCCFRTVNLYHCPSAASQTSPVASKNLYMSLLSAPVSVSSLYPHVFFRPFSFCFLSLPCSLLCPPSQCLTSTWTPAGVSMLTGWWSVKSSAVLAASPVSLCCRPLTTPSLPVT